MIFITVVKKIEILTHYPKIEPCTFKIPWNNFIHWVTIINPKYNGDLSCFFLIVKILKFQLDFLKNLNIFTKFDDYQS
jgi:hypothetical protein